MDLCMDRHNLWKMEYNLWERELQIAACIYNIQPNSSNLKLETWLVRIKMSPRTSAEDARKHLISISEKNVLIYDKDVSKCC